MMLKVLFHLVCNQIMEVSKSTICVIGEMPAVSCQVSYGCQSMCGDVPNLSVECGGARGCQIVSTCHQDIVDHNKLYCWANCITKYPPTTTHLSMLTQLLHKLKPAVIETLFCGWICKITNEEDKAAFSAILLHLRANVVQLS